jgi:hypothetical protein
LNCSRFARIVFANRKNTARKSGFAVPLLMAGSRVEFENRGEWVLKGVPGEWPIFAIKA